MHTQKHRHFVALPVLSLALLAVLGVHQSMPVGASVLSAAEIEIRATEKKESIQLGAFTMASLEVGAAIESNAMGDELSLRKGQALVRSDSYSVTTIGKNTVHALDASFLAIRDGATMTIAPLSAPILVVTQSEEIPLLPGAQLILKGDSASTMRVPPEWFFEQKKAADALKVEPSDAVLSDIVSSVQSGRVTATSLQSLLDASLAEDETGVLHRLILIRMIVEPTRMDEAAAVALAKALNDEGMLRTLAPSLPALVQTLGKPLPAPLLEEWKQAALSAGLDDTATMLRTIHESVSLPRLLKDAGYPVQSTLWRDALLHVGQMLRTSVPAIDLPALDADIAAITRGMTIVEVPAEAQVQKPMTNWSEEELLTLVRSLLVSRGVLLGTTTELTANVDTQQVVVTGVFIAEKSGDMPYTFTVDVPFDRVTSIVRAGEKQPNTLSYDTFFE